MPGQTTNVREAVRLRCAAVKMADGLEPYTYHAMKSLLIMLCTLLFDLSATDLPSLFQQPMTTFLITTFPRRNKESSRADHKDPAAPTDKEFGLLALNEEDNTGTSCSEFTTMQAGMAIR